MRLWSIHPKYIKGRCLIVVWRDALIAQKVLNGQTKCLKVHRQLFRFTDENDPLSAVSYYLQCIFDESCRRNYNFSRTKVLPHATVPLIPVTKGQVEFEWVLFLKMINEWYPKYYEEIKTTPFPDLHPSFRLVPGNKEYWEQPKGLRVTHIIALQKQVKLINTLNELVRVLKPMKFETLNTFWEATEKTDLRYFDMHRPSLSTRTLRDEWDSPWGVNTLAILATITDVLAGKKLDVSVDEKGFIKEFIFLDKNK